MLGTQALSVVTMMARDNNIIQNYIPLILLLHELPKVCPHLIGPKVQVEVFTSLVTMYVSLIC